MKFRKNSMGYQIAAILSSVINEMETDEIADLIELPPQKEMGDFAFPCFKLAKLYHKAPPLIAQDLQNSILSEDKADLRKGLDEVKANGPYVNFFVNREVYISQIMEDFHSIRCVLHHNAPLRIANKPIQH